MNFRNIIRVIGLLVLLFSFISILPILISFIYKDNSESAFLKTFLYSFIIGIFFWIPNKKQKGRLNSREGFLVVVLFWTVLGSLGSLPFLLIKFPYFSVTDAFFESFSGLTTTGATVLLNLEKLPMGILFYRQMLQWFGGMGIIVLAVAILPIEGTKLYYAEIPGPIKDNKICPRISQIAKNLWIIYISLTILCIFLLWIAGMSFFDSVAHSFSIVSIGGFSTKNNSIGHYNSPLINTIVAVFLIISSCNYNLHFSAVHYHSLKVYWKDQEFKVFIGIQIFLFVFCASILYLYKIYDSFLEILNKSFFQVISMSTTAGFITDRSYLWPSVL
ncbi:potassium transporter TrkG, partial [bacterium endosymbiont of Pedicinus badii]|uniref:potassium transporter TrkG n=1 Tax=bacterium endosymbiont of Pedicinus badii TaxID=1719126 RepID=UPI001FB1ED52